MTSLSPGVGTVANAIDPDVLRAAEDAIGYSFSDESLLVRSLTHASIANSRLESNERLEFLGDAILGMVACERIFGLYPNLLEGEMTKIKSVVVSRKACAQIATRMDLSAYMLLGKGIGSNRELIPHSMTAAALEAIIAAVYLDGDYEVVRDWLAPLIDPLIAQAEASGHQQNYKSVLQQHIQQSHGRTPTYRSLGESGPDHAKSFTVCVEVGGDRYEPATGASKKQAEQAAALIALEAMGLIARDGQGQPHIVRSGDEEE